MIMVHSEKAEAEPGGDQYVSDREDPVVAAVEAGRSVERSDSDDPRRIEEIGEGC
jgi:hypothetical protein